MKKTLRGDIVSVVSNLQDEQLAQASKLTPGSTPPVLPPPPAQPVEVL